MLEIKTLKGVSFDELEKVFNLSFSEYYLPIHFTKRQLEEKFLSKNGILELSVGAFEGNKLVGFIFHFYADINNEKVIYNGGTGVIPQKRGNCLTSKMYEFILPQLQKKRIDKMVLEVLTVNKPAIKVYETIGFNSIRTLDCYKGKLAKTDIKNEYEIRELKNYDWLKLQTFWDYEPTWQNSILTMSNLKSVNISLGIYQNNNLLGYLIFNPKEKRINQIAIDKNHRRKGLGKQLINEIAKKSRDNVSLINVDNRMQNAEMFLEKNGMKKVIQQYEMELILSEIYN